MAIPRERIAYWLGCFGDRMNRVYSGPVAIETARGLDSLGLTADEFEIAARALYAAQPFLPTPLDFLYAARPDARPERVAVRAIACLRQARDHWSTGHAQGTAIAWLKVPEDIRAVAREAYEAAGGSVDALTPGQDFGFLKRFEKAVLASERERVERLCLPQPNETLRLASGG